jgi:MFS family permease
VPRIARPLLVLIVLTSINHCCFSGINFALTLYAVKLNAPHVAVGGIIAMYSLFGALSAVAAGQWADRAGARLPMLATSAAMVIGAGLAFVWRELAALFVVSIVVGTAYNAFFVAQQQLMGRFGTLADRVSMFSLSGLGISLANFAGPLISGYSLKSLGYPQTFVLFACLPMAVLAFLLVKPLPDPPAAPPAAGSARAGGALGLLRERELRLIYLVSLFGTATSQLFGFLMPLYGVQIGLDSARIGWVVGSFAAASALSRVVLPFITRHLTPWSGIIGALIWAALCFVLLALSHQLGLLMLGSFGLGLAFGVCNPMAQALLYEAAPPARVGEVLGLRVMMAGLIATVVPVVAGALSTAVGISPIFGGFAAALAGCGYAGRGRVRRGAAAPVRSS